MSYIGSMGKVEWENIIISQSQAVINSLGSSLLAFKKWYNFSYGKTNAEIATLIGATEAEVADMQAAFSVFHDLYDGLDNVAVTAADRLSILTRFGF